MIPNEPSQLKKDFIKLQKAYDTLLTKNEHALLDLKKVKLDAQEERLTHKEAIFAFKQKMTLFESEFNNLKRKVSLTRAEYDALEKELKELQAEQEKLEVELENEK